MNDEERWALVDEILEAEEISDELFKKIGRVLAKKKLSPEEELEKAFVDAVRQSEKEKEHFMNF